MNTDQRRTPRDPAKPIEYFQAFVAREQEGICDCIKYNNPAILFTAAPACVRIGLALYSAGAGVSECLRWFSEAAAYQHRFITEGRKFRFGGAGTIDSYLALYSAAFLAGHSDELIADLKQCTYTETPHPATTRLIAQFCDLLQGRPVETNAAEIAELNSLWKPWAFLPTFFSAVSTKDPAKAAPALDDYLTRIWGPPTEKWAKKALKSPTPEYFGKWALLAAAACRIPRAVPDLSAEAKTYLPVDLVNP
jgi:hypothetical protein